MRFCQRRKSSFRAVTIGLIEILAVNGSRPSSVKLPKISRSAPIKRRAELLPLPKKTQLQAECITQLVRDVKPSNIRSTTRMWIQSAGIDPDLDVGQIIVGGKYQRARA